MNRGFYLFLFPLVIGVIFAVFIAGVKHGRLQHALEETKILHASLEESGDRTDDRFSEYAKGRIYWNNLLYIPADYEMMEDYGPVNGRRLGKVDYRKEPVEHDVIRDRALAKVKK